LFGVQEGQLGQREEPIGTEPRAITTKLGQRALRVLLEAVGEPESV
jgi:hypothetical protein